MTGRAEINNSTINGDVVNGDKNHFEAPTPSLNSVIKMIVDNSKDNHELVEIIDALAEYITDRPDREIIGVEQKLENGGRHDLVKEAIYQKDKFAKQIARRQMSLVEQKIYVQILSSINSDFNLKIRPLILEKKDKCEIDAAILNAIIIPVHQAVVQFNDLITRDNVTGMLYFLTGKCHLVWSEQ
jgi:hypothetical protein